MKGLLYNPEIKAQLDMLYKQVDDALKNDKMVKIQMQTNSFFNPSSSESITDEINREVEWHVHIDPQPVDLTEIRRDFDLKKMSVIEHRQNIKDFLQSFKD